MVFYFSFLCLACGWFRTLISISMITINVSATGNLFLVIVLVKMCGRSNNGRFFLIICPARGGRVDSLILCHGSSSSGSNSSACLTSLSRCLYTITTYVRLWIFPGSSLALVSNMYVSRLPSYPEGTYIIINYWVGLLSPG